MSSAKSTILANAEPLIEGLFRRERRAILRTLARKLGPARADLAEDATQYAFLRAVQIWSFAGTPAEPIAWLRLTAWRRALDLLKQAPAPAIEDTEPPPPTWFAGEAADADLRVITAICDPVLPELGQVTTALNLVAGFTAKEIAELTGRSEAAIHQTLSRARKRLGDAGATRPGDLTPAHLAERRSRILSVLYLMFSEGYAASHGEAISRAEIAGEALRLGRLLASTPGVAGPDAHALVALMALTAARLPARSEGGVAVALDDQDRARWDQSLIALGFQYLERAATGAEISTYHLQAEIAAEHAVARTAADVDWSRIAAIYQRLSEIDPAPVVRLGHAVALARTGHPDAARARLAEAGDTAYVHAAEALLHLDAGDVTSARAAFEAARAGTASEPVKRWFEGRLAGLSRAPEE